jgi:hypothetical protein
VALPYIAVAEATLVILAPLVRALIPKHYVAQPLYALYSPRDASDIASATRTTRKTIQQVRLATNTMAEQDIEELNALFASPPASELEPDVLSELQSIMRLHSIPPQELFYKWESYSIKMGSDDMKLNIDTARALKRDVQDGLEREARNKTHVRQADKRTGATPRAGAHGGDVLGM